MIGDLIPHQSLSFSPILRDNIFTDDRISSFVCVCVCVCVSECEWGGCFILKTGPFSHFFTFPIYNKSSHSSYPLHSSSPHLNPTVYSPLLSESFCSNQRGPIDLSYSERVTLGNKFNKSRYLTHYEYKQNSTRI